MSEYRVEELAQRAGTSVRNVRVYQDRGLLDPPRRQGRVGYYSDDHLERLRLIGRLLDRGYTFATIGELLDAWSDGGGLGRVLGLTDAIGGPWTEEEPGHITIGALRRRFRVNDAPGFVARAVELGVLEPDGTGYRVPSPHLLDAGADLVAAGIPLSIVLDIAVTLREHLDRVAELFFHAVAANLPGIAAAMEAAPDAAGNEGAPPRIDTVESQVAELVAQLRPHALRAVEATFGLAMHEQAERTLQQLARRQRAEASSSAS